MKTTQKPVDFHSKSNTIQIFEYSNIGLHLSNGMLKILKSRNAIAEIVSVAVGGGRFKSRARQLE